MKKLVPTHEMKTNIGGIIKLNEQPSPVKGEIVYTPDSKRLGEIMVRAAEQNRGIPSEVLEDVINQAIEEVRAEERSKRATA